MGLNFTVGGGVGLEYDNDVEAEANAKLVEVKDG